MSTSVKNYRAHTYSGSRKSRKRVLSALKQHHPHDSGVLSRAKFWRKEVNKEILITDTVAKTGYVNLKTYSKKTPILKVKADFKKQNHSCSHLPKSTNHKPEAFEKIWLVTDPAIASHELTIEKDTSDHLNGLSGSRVVEIQHVLRWSFQIGTHLKDCAGSSIKFISENCQGFAVTFTFQCSVCGKEFVEKNVENDTDKLNIDFVSETITSGGSYSQASHLTNVMDIPTMGTEKFWKTE